MFKKCCKSNNNFLYGLIIGVIGLSLISYMSGSLRFNKNGTEQIKKFEKSQTEELVSFVDKAAQLVTEKGESAFTEFRKVDGEWRQGEWYIFAYDLNSKTLVLPPTPEVEGTSRYNTKDSNGKFYVREMATYLKTHNSGWIDYTYPKPGDTESSLKLGYFKKVMVNNKPIFVGSGIYLN